MNLNSIERIFLFNFKNFKEIDADFKPMFKTDDPSVNFLYGENAMGKSNLASSLTFLYSSAHTLFVSPTLLKLLENYNKESKEASSLRNELMEMAKGKNITNYVIQYKRHAAKDQKMVVAFEFNINGKHYEYLISFTKDNLIWQEYLKVRENTRLVDVFKYENGKELYLSKTNFLNQTFIDSIKFSSIKYGGEHSILAILNEEIRVNSNEFTKASMSDTVTTFCTYLDSIVIIEQDDIDLPTAKYYDTYNLLPDIESGEMPISKETDKKIAFTEKYLNYFYKKYMPKIDRVFYNVIQLDGKLNYRLTFDRIDEDGYVDSLSYYEESYGTKQLTHLLNYFYHVLMGKIIVLDDINFGLDERLITEIISDFSMMINDFAKKYQNHHFGELFIITHDTEFMVFRRKFNVFTLIHNNDIHSPIRLKSYCTYGRSFQKSSNLRNIYKNDDYFTIDEGRDINNVLGDLIFEDYKK